MGTECVTALATMLSPRCRCTWCLAAVVPAGRASERATLPQPLTRSRPTVLQSGARTCRLRRYRAPPPMLRCEERRLNLDRPAGEAGSAEYRVDRLRLPRDRAPRVAGT